MPRRATKKNISVTVNKPKNKTLLIDGNALFKTGYHGAKKMYNHRGEHIGGIYQFMTMVRKFLNTDIYQKVFVFWDGKLSGKLRYDIYEDYKGNRNKDYKNGTAPIDDVDQIIQQTKIKEYIEELYIRQLENEIVEADDFIAYYVHEKKNIEDITIVTIDTDLCQLIDDNVRVYLCNPSKKIYITKENYRFNFIHHLDNCVLIKTICGDSSDNIKGIKGIKEQSLLDNFPDLMVRKMNIDEIINESKNIQETRKSQKKKPLKKIDNIINKVTDGIQGNKVFDINRVLVDLSVPMLTNEAKKDIIELMECDLSDDRHIRNVMDLMIRDGVYNDIKNYVEDYFLPFKKLAERERRSNN